MSGGATQLEQLVKMANHIARNLAAWGDEAAVAGKTGEHLRKFWSPAMRARLQQYSRDGGDDLSPAARRAVALLEQEQLGDKQ